MTTVTEAHIEEGLLNLGLKGKVVEVHSSLSSFGNVIGGAGSVVNALTNVSDTILMPTYDSTQQIRPPENDRPQQNGIDYSRFGKKPPGYDQKVFARRGLSSPRILSRQTRMRLKRAVSRIRVLAGSWKIPDHLLDGLTRTSLMQFIKSVTIIPFDPDSFGNDSLINNNMGIISKTLLSTPGTVRSKHPTVSWAGNGPHAEYYLVPHPPDDSLLPLRKLYEDNGYALLLGASLSSCTALHLSEEMVGRRAFIRWVLYSDGVVRRVRQCGCIGGAVHLESAFEGFSKRTRIGLCEAVVYPIRDMVDTGATIIRRSPEITLCSDGKGCELCIDTAKGGPIE